MKVIFSGHSEERILGRNLQKWQIVEIINNPIEVIHDDKSGRDQCFGIIDKSTNRYLRIIYSKLKNEDVLIVITAMETDKGGLIANGFSKL